MIFPPPHNIPKRSHPYRNTLITECLQKRPAALLTITIARVCGQDCRTGILPAISGRTGWSQDAGEIAEQRIGNVGRGGAEAGIAVDLADLEAAGICRHA